jgi:hypothetical protein
MNEGHPDISERRKHPFGSLAIAGIPGNHFDIVRFLLLKLPQRYLNRLPSGVAVPNAPDGTLPQSYTFQYCRRRHLTGRCLRLCSAHNNQFP